MQQHGIRINVMIKWKGHAKHEGTGKTKQNKQTNKPDQPQTNNNKQTNSEGGSRIFLRRGAH